MNRFLSFVPFVLLNLRAPEGAQGGGGGEGNPDPAPDPDPAPTAPPQDPPTPTGETMEARLTSSGGIIKSLWGQVKDLTSRLSTSNNERTKVEGQFNAATQGWEKEKTEHATTKTQLGDANTKITGLTTERDNANKNVERLEKLCGNAGLDSKQVVSAQTGPASGGSKAEQYKDLKQQENDDKVQRGTASKFYRKHKKEIDQ